MMCGQRWNGWNIFSCRRYYPNERLLIWHTYYKKGRKIYVLLAKDFFLEKIMFSCPLSAITKPKEKQKKHIFPIHPPLSLENIIF